MVWVHLNTLVLFLLHQTFKCLCVVKIKISSEMQSLLPCYTSHFYHFTLYFIESSKPNPNQISTSNGKPGAVNGAVGTTFQPQNPLLGRSLWELLLWVFQQGLFPTPAPTPRDHAGGTVGGWESALHGEQDKVASEWIDAPSFRWTLNLGVTSLICFCGVLGLLSIPQQCVLSYIQSCY